MDETALFPLPGVYFKLDRGHRRDEDPRMYLPCYKNLLQICNSLQGLCLSLYYHFWFQRDMQRTWESILLLLQQEKYGQAENQ